MEKVQYGKTEIEFRHRVNPDLKNAYITVDFYEGVVLKSPPISKKEAAGLVLKKASWIIEKLKLVSQIPAGDIVTGSRLLYLGKRYYVKVVESDQVKSAMANFCYSRFSIEINPSIVGRQMAIKRALKEFYLKKAVEKITARINKGQNQTGLKPRAIKFRTQDKRWGSCTKYNEIILNKDAVKLPFSLIDYIVVHELCHILHKDHSREFWKEVGKYLPEYKELDEMVGGMML